MSLPLKSLLFAFLVLWTLSPASALAQTCPVSTSNVEIRLRTPPSSVNATDRREHVRISLGLLQALCLDPSAIHANGDDSPQIRIAIVSDTNPGAPSSPRSTALFTVVGVDTLSIGKWVEVYTRRTSSDTNNGLRKLFPYLGSSGSLDPARVVAEAYRLAPHATAYVDYRLSSTKIDAVTTHFSDPNASARQFEEYLQLEASKELALVVPHGDNIETHIDEQIGRFENAAAVYGVDTNIWEGRGRWGSGETSRRWHITSSDLHPASFPGLEELFDAPDYATGRPFRWAMSLHGFTGRELTTHPNNIPPTDQGGAYYGVILGGRSDAETKCYLAMKLQDRYGNRRDQVAITLVYHDANGTVQTLEIPGLGGVIDGADDLGGVDPENIVNRLAPWSAGQIDRGAVQVELSKSLRFDEHFSDPYIPNPESQLLESTVSALGQGIAQLNGYPPAAEGACDALRQRNGL